ncbi:MAG: PHP domain-containing protein [Lachnospiraceae bacterium]
MKKNSSIDGFQKEGNWYKGNLHCHTTNSDGSLTPSEVAKLYKEHGYSFLAISDHDLYSDYRNELDQEDFIILPALEASAVLYQDERKNRAERVRIHHIHGILGNQEMQENASKGLFSHLEKYPEKEFIGTWNGAEVAQKLQDDLKAHGCLTIYNHPVWSRVKEEEFIHTEGLNALEIYNYGSVNESATGFDSLRWDVMLRAGTKIFATASDDNHNDGIIEDSFGGFIVVKAQELTHEAIINSILEGSYYSSNGPQIFDWGIKENVAYVTCSPVRRVNFVAGNYINAGAAVLSESGENTLTQAEFPLRGNESYIRVECVDANGKTAWSNPIFLENFM